MFHTNFLVSWMLQLVCTYDFILELWLKSLAGVGTEPNLELRKHSIFLSNQLDMEHTTSTDFEEVYARWHQARRICLRIWASSVSEIEERYDLVINSTIGIGDGTLDAGKPWSFIDLKNWQMIYSAFQIKGIRMEWALKDYGWDECHYYSKIYFFKISLNNDVDSDFAPGVSVTSLDLLFYPALFYRASFLRLELQCRVSDWIYVFRRIWDYMIIVVVTARDFHC